MQTIKENLKKLCLATGVAGYENTASNVAADLLKEYTPDVNIDVFGNVLGKIKCGKENAKSLLLDAHIDEIGMIVTAIDDKGFLKVGKCGGLDMRIMAAQEVCVHCKDADLVGIIGSKPPHLEKGDEAKQIPDIDKMFVDIGLSKEQAQKIVSQGDRITIVSEFNELLNGRVSVKSLDDRCGVAAILESLNLLKGKEINFDLDILFSAQEETGGAGAKIGAFKVAPDSAIVVDVSHAKTFDEDEFKCGKMGEGVMIGFAAILDYAMSQKMVELAKNANIPFQAEVMSGRTGTNADEIVVTKEGVKAVTLSIPQAYMHTPIEVCEISDIEAVAKLIAEYAILEGE